LVFDLPTWEVGRNRGVVKHAAMDVKTIGEVIDENPLCFMMTQTSSADAAENNVSMSSHGLHGDFQKFSATITADFRLSTLSPMFQRPRRVIISLSHLWILLESVARKNMFAGLGRSQSEVTVATEGRRIGFLPL
jgi:hypothetical protein